MSSSAEKKEEKEIVFKPVAHPDSTITFLPMLQSKPQLPD